MSQRVAEYEETLKRDGASSLLTVEEVAKILKTSARTVVRLRAERLLRFTRIRSDPRLSRVELARFLASGEDD